MNEQLKKLMDKRNKLVHDMRAILEANPEGLTPEQEQKYAAMEKDMDALGAQIDRLKNMIDLEAKLDEPMAQPMVAAAQAAAKTGENVQAYKEAFFDFVRNGYNGASESSRKLLAKYRASLTEGTDAKGGYLVPTVIAKEIITGLNAQSWIRKLANVYSTTSTTDIPTDTSIPSFNWMGESDSYNETDLDFGGVTIGAHKVGGIIKISEELMEDSAFDLEAHLTGKIQAGLEASEEQAFISGDGNGKPTGIVTSAGTGVTAASATAITSDEVLDFIYSPLARYRKNAVVVASTDFVKAVRKLKDGNGQYIWQPNYQAGQPDTIAGKPLYESEYMDGLESGKTPAVIADFSYYDVADRGRMYLQRLNELYAASGFVGFRVRKRTEGKLTLADAAKKLVMG